MGGLAKGLAIIEAFAIHGVLSVSDAARASGTTRAAARRCLITLTRLGYVDHSGREFRPLPRLRSLGGTITKRDQIARLAEPILARARDELAESVSLAVLDNDTALFIARAEAEHIVSTGVRVGAHLPVSADSRFVRELHTQSRESRCFWLKFARSGSGHTPSATKSLN
jgi:IclR family pca regulon transcriptional regulator